MKRLPQDISNLLAICIRDLIWFKDKILSFLKECEVPTSILIQVHKKKDLPTVQLIPWVLEELYSKGDEGYLVARKMLTKIYYWKDVYSIPADRKDQAMSSLKELQKIHKLYINQELYEQEKKSQKEREQRVQLSKIDHEKLKKFRERFDSIYMMEPMERGNAYEDLINDIFSYYFPDTEKSFNRIGEQIDGQFYFDGHWYFVEVRWREQKTSASDISVLRDRARRGFAGDVRAVFISFNGFSLDCLKSLDPADERVILLNGYDLRFVLECEIALDVLLHDIQKHLIKIKYHILVLLK